MSVIARALKSEGSLSFKTHACYVLNTLATNCFVSHKNLVASGVLPCLVDSLTIRGAAPKEALNAEHGAKMAAAINPAIRERLEALPTDARILVVVRGLPGSGKTHLSRTVSAYLQLVSAAAVGLGCDCCPRL